MKYTATLFRQFYGNKEYKYITVQNIADIQKYCINGWRCVNYSACY